MLLMNRLIYAHQSKNKDDKISPKFIEVILMPQDLTFVFSSHIYNNKFYEVICTRFKSKKSMVMFLLLE